MTSRLLPITLTAAALLVAAVPAGAAPADKCKKAGASVLEQQGNVRILRTAKGGDLLTCRGKAKPVFLFDGASNEKALGLRVAGGRYVALVDRRVAPVDGIPERALRVRDVKSGATRRADLSGGGPDDDSAETALTSGGVAAVDDGDSVLVLDVARKQPVVVATGGGISELAASGGTIYWTQNGVAHSTPAAAPVAAPPAPTGATGVSGATGATGPSA